ncbi:TRM11 family SAM-dependent methyltransferase [Catenulispora pinisilvae]|uniref:TRM11 family SAM-dependent methyltransferase n=1 Tax=Catenulispora pinisilvae TaxID=2705253 RepID=UPI001890F709|nr:DNA methyltransferase [Catenulispora pinisilvae]
MPETPTAPPRTPTRNPAAIPTSVWVTAQRNSRAQRAGRYVPESVAHPARMLPDIAAHAITSYTEPGDLVADPMCGIGTTLVEAMHLGRRALGVEYEARWVKFAKANIALAASQGATGTEARVIRADARKLATVVPPELLGSAALVITSPPYGAAVHGQIKATALTGESGVQKSDYRYSTDRANLAHVGREQLIAGFAEILAGCRKLLRPGGMVAVTARPWREHGELIDLPSEVIAAGVAAGLEPTERCLALIAGVRDRQLITRPSFFQLANIRQARAAGVPMHLIVAEDVLLFRAGRGAPRQSQTTTESLTAEPEPTAQEHDAAMV